MPTLYELKRDKNRYENLSNRLESVVRRLNSAKDDLAKISSDIDKYYSKNGINADEGKFNSIRKEIRDISNYIDNNVQDSIRNKIYHVSTDIKNYNEEEAL